MISFENLARDLTHWETMLVSTMMQRPIKTIVKNDEIWEHQMKNLKSAVRSVNTLSYIACSRCTKNLEWVSGGPSL